MREAVVRGTNTVLAAFEQGLDSPRVAPEMYNMMLAVEELRSFTPIRFYRVCSKTAAAKQQTKKFLTTERRKTQSGIHIA